MTLTALHARQTLHHEAIDWASRVVSNGGTASMRTIREVSRFCRDIDAAGIRSKITRLNLFVGSGLSAALVPLYRSSSFGGSVVGNTTDTNVNFVAGDWNETGASSGFLGNGSTKYLNPGVPGNTFTGADHHHGYGLRATQSGSAAYKNLGGMFNGSNLAYDVSARRNDSLLTARFGGLTSTFNAGEAVQSSSLAVGNIVASYPSVYRNGSAVGTNATASSNYTATTAWFIFALNNNGTPINHTDARLNWYSIGSGLSSSQVTAFNDALNRFNTAMGRT